jgi:proline-specific peptidase
VQGRIEVPGGEVWFARYGGGSQTPLLLLHGGPGASSAMLTASLPQYVTDHRAVYVYDQLGSGRSDRPDDTGLWTLDRFVQELAVVREALGLSDIHVLGHSWGAMLATSAQLGGAAGLRSLILADPCLSAPAWARDQRLWLAELAPELQIVIRDAEAAGTTDSAPYQQAMDVYYRKHVCRLDPWPPELEADFAQMNLQVYGHMWGASEFTVTGTLREFDVTPQLSSLDLPVLFVCGEHDEARPDTVRQHAALVPGAECSVIADASHTPHLEEPAQFWDRVVRFLAPLG